MENGSVYIVIGLMAVLLVLLTLMYGALAKKHNMLAKEVDILLTSHVTSLKAMAEICKELDQNER